jgi:glycosyltransferase involved in cell wall biosynthesis
VGSIHYDPDHVSCLGAATALKALCDFLGGQVVVIVDHPAWHPILSHMRGCVRVVYDCIDLIGAFPNTPLKLLKSENMLIREADVVLASSRAICQYVGQVRAAVIVPNGAELRHFSPVACKAPSASQVEILYFGAISHWFDVALVRRVARRLPNWRFTLIGEADRRMAEGLGMAGNVHLVGEVHYKDLPVYLARASAAIIPFKINSLTEGVNPVKVYEYLAAGRPVVATALPELIGTPHVVTANNARDFANALLVCVNSDSPEARLERSRWAAGQDWDIRAKAVISSALGSAAHKL